MQCGILEKLAVGRCGLVKIVWNTLRKCMHFIRRDVSATYKLKTRYRYFIRLSKTDKTSRTNLIYQTNLIRFRRRAIVEFNCSWDLELNSSELNSAITRRINQALDSITTLVVYGNFKRRAWIKIIWASLKFYHFSDTSMEISVDTLG